MWSEPAPPLSGGRAPRTGEAAQSVADAGETGEASPHHDLPTHLGLALFRTDEGGRWTFLTRAWTQITGYTVEESLRMPSRLYVHQADLLKSTRLIRVMQRNPGVLCRETLRVRKADGEHCVIEVNARLEAGPHNAPVSVSGYLAEVPQRTPTRLRPALPQPDGNSVATRSARLNMQASLTLLAKALQSLSGTALSADQARWLLMAKSGTDALRGLIDRAPSMPRATSTRPMRILLVEDQPVTQKLVALLLEKWGHSVHVAGDGRVGLDAFVHGTFDLVLMDLQMPVMDGFAATHAMREYEARCSLARTPIVAMTAQSGSADRELCLQSGMDDFLPKPVTASALEHILRQHYRLGLQPQMLV
jgi:PAS domain S-box-containing protein